MWRDEAYLLDILLSARKMLTFTRGVTEVAFRENEMLQDAVVRRIEIIGEAARRVSQACRDEHPEIPWRKIVGMRNRLIHEYFRIDLPKVWEVVRRDIPALVPLVEPLVPPEEEA